MTSNQINNAARKEEARANRAREEETRRSNLAREAETERSNKENERIKHSGEKRMQINTLSDIFNSVTNAISNAKKGFGNKVSEAATLIKLLNDSWWYTPSEEILKDVASIPTYQPTGTIPANDDAIGYTVGADTQGVGKVMEEGHNFATAGYCHFTYMPTIGNSLMSSGNSDGANLTAQNIYSFVRRANSGAKNYERADYMMYLLAVNGPLSYYSWMKRIYGILNYANIYNKYLPKHILNDMNVDYYDLSNRIADLRAYINMFAVRVNGTMAIPSEMPYYVRHQFLNTYLFSDSKSKKHQLYFFSPRKYFVWKIDPNNDATMLDLEDPWEYTGASKLGVDDIVAFGNHLIDTLLSQEDVGLMVGDTEHAFGDSRLAKLPPVDEKYVVEIGTSDEILDQITNIRFAKKNLIGCARRPDTADSNRQIFSIVGYDPTSGLIPATHTYDFTVHQNVDSQTIYQDNKIKVKLDMSGATDGMKWVWNGADRLVNALAFNDSENDIEVNFLTDDTSPARVMTSTRLIPVIKCLKANVNYEQSVIKDITAEYDVKACGSEIILEGFVSVLYWNKSSQSAQVATYELYDGIVEFTSTLGTAATGGAFGSPFSSYEQMISDFDYHPCINIYHTISSGAQAAGPDPTWIRRYAKLWDRNVSTYVSRETISKMHSAAILGEFNVAQIGLTPKSSLK